MADDEVANAKSRAFENSIQSEAPPIVAKSSIDIRVAPRRNAIMRGKTLRTTIAFLACVAFAGSADADGRKPPPFPSFANGDPQAYSHGFSAAVGQAVVKAATNKAYLLHLGDLAQDQSMPIAGWPACDRTTLDAFGRDPSALCQPAQMVMSDASCSAKRWCAQVSVSPTLAKDPRYGPVILRALLSPCSALVDPATLSPAERRLRPRAIAFDAGELWSLMRCGSRRPIKGATVEYSDAHQAYRVRFD